MDILICMRKTIDWTALNCDNFLSQEDCYLSDSITTIAPIVKKWNEFYGLSYFDYRAKVKEIAQQSLFATGLPIVSMYDAADCENTLLVPVDDDDWVAPDLKDIVCVKEALIWKFSVYRPHRIVVKENAGWKANNVAILNSGLKRFLKDNTIDNFGSSTRSRSFFTEYSKIDKCLSVKNHHWGSITYMKNNSFPFSSPGKSKMPDEFSWAEPLIDQMVELNESL